MALPPLCAVGTEFVGEQSEAVYRVTGRLGGVTWMARRMAGDAEGGEVFVVKAAPVVPGMASALQRRAPLRASLDIAVAATLAAAGTAPGPVEPLRHPTVPGRTAAVAYRSAAQAEAVLPGAPPGAVLCAAADVAECLAALHRGGPLLPGAAHCDVSPTNVLVGRGPAGVRAWLVDGGSARGLHTPEGCDAAVGAELLESTDGGFTMPFADPALADPDRGLAAAPGCDVFALGRCVEHWLGGGLPPSAAGVVAAMVGPVEGRPTPDAAAETLRPLGNRTALGRLLEPAP